MAKSTQQYEQELEQLRQDYKENPTVSLLLRGRALKIAYEIHLGIRQPRTYISQKPIKNHIVDLE